MGMGNWTQMCACSGQKIDAQMQDAGFNNHIGTDHVTGFVFGGNTR